MDASPSCLGGTTLDWLARLVAHQTVSGTDSNLDLIAEIEAFLRPLGFVNRVTCSADGRRANLFASRGSGPGGLLLSGHTDVVPVSGQAWTRPPFELTQDAHRLYGRGVCDMKGFIAAVLAVVERLEMQPSTQPLHLAFTYDEEIGCLGVRGLLADLAVQGIRPAACIVGEPTFLRIVRAHKGRHAMHCRVRGRAAHSSLSGTGVNALEVASGLIAGIARQAEFLKSALRDDDFYIPYSTLASCRFHAGTATNVIPAEAEFDFDLRYLPGQAPDQILDRIRAQAAEAQAEMRLQAPECEITIDRRTSVPALTADERTTPLMEMIVGAGGTPGPNVAFTTEGGLYQAHGIPTVIFGPGAIEQAHTADEFIEKSQLILFESILEKLLASECPASDRN